STLTAWEREMQESDGRCDCVRRHVPRLTSRRELIFRAGAGFGALALAALLNEDASAASGTLDPLAPKPPHFAARAKSVIWLFMEGGPSHLELFDPKPELQRLAGQPLPASFGPRPITSMGTSNNALLPTLRTFKPYGKSGIPV